MVQGEEAQECAWKMQARVAVPIGCVYVYGR